MAEERLSITRSERFFINQQEITTLLFKVCEHTTYFLVNNKVCEQGLQRSLFRYVFDVVKQCLTTALFTARADGSSASPAPQDFCKACLWQVTGASIDLRDPNTN